MSKIYCPNCGAENYSAGGIVPNFCFNCGTPLKRSVASSSRPPIKKDVDESIQDEPVEEGFEGVDIKVSKGSQKQSLEEVVSKPLGSGSGRRGLNKRRSDSGKVWEDFKKEASAIKRGEGKEIDE